MADLISSDPEPLTRDVTRFLDLAREGSGGPHVYAALLGLHSYDLPYLLKRVQQGLPFAALEHLRKNLELSWEDLSRLLAIPDRTLTRRKSEGRFLPEESDRILRASRLYAKALELFEGDGRAAANWLSTPQRALAGASPVDLARTELGSREVESLLDQLEQGVFI